ncbi:MAG: CDP-alcohol phosphatidyltransferase family protein [Candidatus Babeliales bacterium]
MIERAISLFKEIPVKEKRLTFATFFTLIRISLVPVIASMMIMQRWDYAFIFFLLGAGTDALDGFFARLFDQQTFLGACLDPIADKLLIIVIFFTLAFVQSPLFSIPRWFVLIVFMKELILIGGASWIYYKTGKLTIKPTLLGKCMMFLQIMFICWLFACYFFHWVPVKTYYSMLGLVVLGAFASLIHYTLIGIRFYFSASLKG